MPPDKLQKLLDSLTTAVNKSKSSTKLQDPLDSLQQLVDSLGTEPLHPLALSTLSTSLADSLLTLLRSSASAQALALLAELFNRLLVLLGELYSPESETERFTEGEEGKGEALEGALEALVRGLKEYSVEWKPLGKEAMALVGEHCYRPLVALLSTPKLKVALKRKTIDILDNTISHHSPNKDRLIQSSLLGPSLLGALILSLADYVLTERALELAFRLRDRLTSGGGEKKERERKVSKWDELMWKELEGEGKVEVMKRWRGIEKASYPEDSAELLGLLSSRDPSNFHLIHALTLSANGQSFIGEDEEPPSTAFNEVVSFNRATFTATTTREISKDESVLEMLELELSSVKRVKIGEGGKDSLSVHIISFHPPTLDSTAMPRDGKAKNSEHYISFTIRAEDLTQLTEILDSRDLLWESSVQLGSRKSKSLALPTPAKSPPPAAIVKRQPAKSKTAALKEVVAPSKDNSKSQPGPRSKRKEVAVKKSTSSKQGVVEAPVKLVSKAIVVGQPTSKSSAPSSTRPPPSKAIAEQPRQLPRSPAPVPVKIVATAGQESIKQSIVKDPKAAGAVTTSKTAAGTGGTKRKALSEGGEAAALLWAGEEVLSTTETTRKKQKVDNGGGKQSKSVAFEQSANKSPLQQRISAFANSPSRRPAPRASVPHRRRSVEAPALVLAPSSDPIGVEDSGYSTGGFDDGRWQDGGEWQMDIDGGEEEEDEDDLLNSVSQIMQSGTKREKQKVMELLRQGAGVASSDVEEGDGVESVKHLQAHTHKSPARPVDPFANTDRVPPAAVIAEEPQPVRFSPRKMFQRRPHHPQHGSASKSKGKSVDSAREKAQGGAGNRQSKHKSSSKVKASPRVNTSVHPQASRRGGEQEVRKVDPDEEHIRQTLAQLSEVVVHNYVHRRETSRQSFGVSKGRIEKHARKCAKIMNQQTRAIAQHGQQQVAGAQEVRKRLQQLRERSKGFGNELRKAMS